jgi:hypothetical protein
VAETGHLSILKIAIIEAVHQKLSQTDSRKFKYT